MLAEISGESIKKALIESDEFKRLYNEHHLIEKRLAKMSKANYLSVDRELERKRLQKVKLAGKDRMAQIMKSV